MENLLRRSTMQAVTKKQIGRMQERWVLETDRTAIAMRQGLDDARFLYGRADCLCHCPLVRN